VKRHPRSDKEREARSLWRPIIDRIRADAAPTPTPTDRGRRVAPDNFHRSFPFFVVARVSSIAGASSRITI